MSIQKYIDSLHKDEIRYELAIIGVSTDENVTNDALRKQIRQVYKLARRGSMKCEPLQSPSIASELEICTPKVELLESQLQAGKVDDRNLTLKLSRRANYLMDRLARIFESSSHLSDLRSRLIRILSVIDGEDSDTDSEYKETQAQPSNQKVESNVIYVKDKPLNLNTFNLKFDETTCVRVFIERLEELKEARNITEARILSAFSDLLENSSLCWFRSNKDNIHSYSQLLKCLRDDFDIPDFRL
ncbi:unnamed protein product [Parnassius apollo]|uniref:(apollo) hypothetical protein n=1 Tax=Parnassius apollo TaxID=110799 RepID=A0A8S3VZ75_PARAO|nr:unnamed protein product [Parnassius apollo]